MRVWKIVSLLGLMLALSPRLSVPAFSDAAPAQDEAAEHPLDLETILDTPLGDKEYQTTRRCLSHRVYHNIEILDDQHIAFYGRGGKIWLNQLHRRCYGLRRNLLLQFELHDSRLCELDIFTGSQRSSISSSGYDSQLTGACLLGQFEAIDKSQLNLLREAFKKEAQSRKQKRGSRKKKAESGAAKGAAKKES